MIQMTVSNLLKEDSFQMTQEFCCNGVTGMIAAFSVAMIKKTDIIITYEFSTFRW